MNETSSGSTSRRPLLQNQDHLFSSPRGGGASSSNAAQQNHVPSPTRVRRQQSRRRRRGRSAPLAHLAPAGQAIDEVVPDEGRRRRTSRPRTNNHVANNVVEDHFATSPSMRDVYRGEPLQFESAIFRSTSARFWSGLNFFDLYCGVAIFLDLLFGLPQEVTVQSQVWVCVQYGICVILRLVDLWLLASSSPPSCCLVLFVTLVFVLGVSTAGFTIWVRPTLRSYAILTFSWLVFFGYSFRLLHFGMELGQRRRLEDEQERRQRNVPDPSSFLSVSNMRGNSCIVCTICFENIMPGKQDEKNIRIVPGCGHVYHASCVDPWLLSRKRCPNCMASVHLSMVDPETGQMMQRNTSSSSASDDSSGVPQLYEVLAQA